MADRLKKEDFVRLLATGMTKEINPWAMNPRKTSTASVPESLKMEVTSKANELIETVLKPKYIQPPLEDPQFNYIVDIYGKWYHKARSTFVPNTV